MHNVKYSPISKELLKIAIENQEIENFRDYTVLRYNNIPRGEFTLRQLAKIYNITNVSKFVKQRYKKFVDSVFFEHIRGDKFRFISYKKILIKYNNTANTTIYSLPLFIFSTRRAFFDACIGLCLLNKPKSNETASKLFKCTERRIQQATKRNNEKGLIFKHFRKAVEPCESYSKAITLHNKLKDIGIFTSIPFNYKGGQAISVNRTNKYTSGVVSRRKGIIRKRTHATRGKREQWYKPAFRGKASRDTRLYYESRYNCKFFEFNDKVYSFDDFVLDHAVI